jgi:hypothetical protein
MSNIVTAFKEDASNKQSLDLITHPELADHGVPEHNVFKRVSGEDFAEFYNQVCEAAEIALKAYESTNVSESVSFWKQLFGNKFPDAPIDDNDGERQKAIKSSGFTPREEISHIGGGRFA